jgi:ribulose-phosphate 3-epimerase
MEIIPAIMPDSYDDLLAKAGRVRGLVPLAQIDIMDGMFVKSKSWPYATGGVKRDEHFVALAAQEEGMPYWEELDYEIDLMIAEPEKHIDEWLPLGASRLIFHIEAIKDHAAFWGHDIFKEGARDVGGEKVIQVGLAINADTPLEAIMLHVEQVEFVQCMGIAKIGYQGEPFDERVLDRANQLRVNYPNLVISVDGGVSLETAPLLKAAGANRLVAGSAVFGAEDIALAIRDLEKS